MKNRSSLVLVAVCFGLLAAGCDSSSKDKKADAAAPAAPKQANMGIVNTKCPVMPSHPAGVKVVTEHKGQKVGLCCAGCMPAWNKLNDEQKDAALAAAK